MIFLTGSSGFIGKHFLALNRKDVIPVKRVDNTSSEYDLYKAYRSNIDECQNSNNAVVHLGGLAHGSYDDSSYDLIVDSTINLAMQAVDVGIKRFVFVSSVAVNGPSSYNHKFSPLSEANPRNYFAKAKLRAESQLGKLECETGLELVIVRPTLVYGANAPMNMGLLINLVAKMPALPFGLAENRLNFICVHNLVDLLLTCATHFNAPGNVFLASDTETVSIKDFTNLIAKGMGKTLYQLPIPISFLHVALLLAGKGSVSAQLLGNLEVDSSHVKDVLGWTPPYKMGSSMCFFDGNIK